MTPFRSASVRNGQGSPVTGYPEDDVRDATLLFESDDSLSWFLRANRSSREAAGAVLKLATGVYVDPDKFESIALDLMQRPARSSGGLVGDVADLVG